MNKILLLTTVFGVFSGSLVSAQQVDEKCSSAIAKLEEMKIYVEVGDKSVNKFSDKVEKTFGDLAEYFRRNHGKKIDGNGSAETMEMSIKSIRNDRKIIEENQSLIMRVMEARIAIVKTNCTGK